MWTVHDQDMNGLLITIGKPPVRIQSVSLDVGTAMTSVTTVCYLQ